MAILLAATTAPATGQIQSPDAFLGRSVGGDGVLVSYDEQIPYFEYLAENSDRVILERVGRSTAGRDLILLVVSTPENLARREEIREISARLDDPRGLSAAAVDSLARRGRAVVCVAFNIHSDEIAASQTALKWVYQLATGDSEGPAGSLDEVILLVIPSLNPDGQVMISDWREANRGTAALESPLPGLYHPYAGHDNNRDWFMLNLQETRVWHETLYRTWFPQVLVDHHQMGARGPRMFVPPYTDPVTEHVHPLIHRYSSLLGSAMAMGLERAGRSGVIQGYMFDAYWPGGTRSTPWWKNTVGILTETASARGMSPIRIAPDRLRGGGKGLVDYQRQVNFPNPWPGGVWRAADVIDYEIIASDALLEACARERGSLLRDRARMALDAVHQGRTGSPRGWWIPARQQDPGSAAALVDLLRAHGIEVQVQTTDPDAFHVPADQPARPFLKEMLERQSYRQVRSAPGEAGILPPYDVTSWSLPELTGVTVTPVSTPPSGAWTALEGPAWIPWDPGGREGSTWILPAENLDSYAAAARFLSRGYRVARGEDRIEVGATRISPGWFLVEAPTPAVRAVLGNLRLRPLLLGGRGQAVTWNARGIASEFPIPPPAARTISLPRIAVYQPRGGSPDAGWTHFVLDRFSVPHAEVGPAAITAPGLPSRFDLIILPDLGRDELVEGGGGGDDDPEPGAAPARPRNGLGEAGVAALEEFVNAGGTLVTLGRAAELPLGSFDLPLRRSLSERKREEVSTPGTSVRVLVDVDHPLGFGLPEESVVFRTEAPLLLAQGGARGKPAQVVARYPENGPLVLSGHAEGADRLRRHAALVEVPHGLGRVVLFDFRPQHRGQTWATYRFLLNAVLDPRGRANSSGREPGR